MSEPASKPATIWSTIDQLATEHDDLVAWLRESHGGWTLQTPSARGEYVARRRESAGRAPQFARSKTADGIREQILAIEKEEAGK